MKAELIEQFNSIRKTLSNNVSTIEMLVGQAKALSEIAENINGVSSADEKTKKKLTEEIDKIQNSIKDLIHQTNTLFDLYEQFAKAIFEQR